MAARRPDNLLVRGRQCLFIGFFTSWLGVGFLFILAAAVMGIIGMCGERAGKSFVLLLSSLVVGVISFFIAHAIAVAGIVAFTNMRENRKAQEPAVQEVQKQPQSRSKTSGK
jgi:hypothetical protein